MGFSLSDMVRGVMHCHSEWAIAYAYNHDMLPMTTLHVKLKLGHDIPILDVDSPMLLEEHVPIVRALFEKNPKLTAFILRGTAWLRLGLIFSRRSIRPNLLRRPRKSQFCARYWKNKLQTRR